MAKRFEAVLTEQLQDPAVRARWERTAVARAIAISVLRYRTAQGLSQKQLAERLGWKQSQVARLELGEHTPTLDTLVHLSRMLGLEVLVDIRPAGRRGAQWVTSEAEQAGVTERFTTEEGGRLLVAAG
jgi:transcriptional regulator with XRE-family HTH domain